ncbi:DNA translocase FtsK 4TM domain-containing protein [bacterium]|nr:DNA translocase FtsK 4TM domain-containing protein [candidate division CSSED10-310 bacterium]
MATSKNSPKKSKNRKSDYGQTSNRLSDPRHMKWIYESTGILLSAAAIFIFIALLSGTGLFLKGDNICGEYGKIVSEKFWTIFGFIALLFPLFLLLIGVMMFRHRKVERWISRLIGMIVLIPFLASLVSDLTAPVSLKSSIKLSGGILGRSINAITEEFLGPWGSKILAFALVLIAVLIITDISYYMLSKRVKHSLLHLLTRFYNSCCKRFSTWKERRLLKKEFKAEQKAMVLDAKRQKQIEENEIEEATEIKPPTIVETPMLPFQEMDEFEQDDVEEEETLRDHSPQDVELYQKPPMELLDEPSEQIERDSEAELLRKSETLIQKLKDFNIEGRVTEVCPGPVITRFEFEPAPGIKISKITSLSNDLALGLRSRYGLRVAPIPGKSTLGVEIPNNQRETVHLRDLLLSEEFRTATSRSILSIPLGKTTAGQPYITDLKRMPHLLIAGATGSGKSVCINSILCGFLFSVTPYQIRFILIDPKMLELSDFNGIPHLREPVITDVKKSPEALKWAVAEMNERYHKLAELGVRNIDQFNKKVTDPGYDGDYSPLPYIIVVIDELADLMLTAPTDIEEAIQRLAQMARASGIHLIIATQRPSVDVITGVIKANLPCRLAFQVASKIDSRTILDAIGAEKLLGMGDCLFIPPGTSQILRLHAAFVSDREIKQVVRFLKDQAVRIEEEPIFESMAQNMVMDGDFEDPLYNEAVKLVLTTNLASISMLQRRLKVGHSRAARLIDTMELNGIVGPHEGSKPREILVDREEYLDRLHQIEEDGVYDDVD